MTDGKRPEAGILQDLGNGIARVLAPNPSPMTFWGTNSYLLGDKSVAVIDPGPASPCAASRSIAAVRPARLSPKARTGAPVASAKGRARGE